MIIDSFDDKTPSLVKLADFYGEQKHLVDKCIITFSSTIYQYLLDNYQCEQIGKICACNGFFPIYKTSINGENVAFYLSMIGSALASQFLIECNHLVGARKFVVFGSAGSIDNEKTYGKYVIPTASYRDEGMSYHYAPPSDYINIKNHGKVKEIFDELNLPNVEGKIWTTDAFLRETVGLIAKRKEEGCIAVEMEVAGLQSVCDFYGFELYDFLVTGDVLSTIDYDVGKLREANNGLDKLFIAFDILKRI